jgi:hypothetical protein
MFGRKPPPPPLAACVVSVRGFFVALWPFGEYFAGWKRGAERCFVSVEDVRKIARSVCGAGCTVRGSDGSPWLVSTSLGTFSVTLRVVPTARSNNALCLLRQQIRYQYAKQVEAAEASGCAHAVP